LKKTFTLLLLIAISFGCRKSAPPAKASEEPASVTVSDWTQKTELFLEYPALVAGDTSRFSVHFTSLTDFKPLKQGQATVRLIDAAGAEQVFTSPAPSRPGIFGMDVKPRSAGFYQMTVQLSSSALGDSHELGAVIVYPVAAQAAGHAASKKEESISFLKEQQWAMEFATALVQERTLRESLSVPGEVHPKTGGEVEVTAPSAGRILAASEFPAIGSTVQKGQILATLIPRTANLAERANLELAVSEATTELNLARKDQGRAERLFASGAVPARRVEEAEAQESLAAARFKASENRLKQYEATRTATGESSIEPQFPLRAPIAGIVAEVLVPAGTSVEEGQKICHIVSIDPVYVAAIVPEADAYRLRQLNGGEILWAGQQSPHSLGRQVSSSPLVDPATRTRSVFYETSNSGRQLAIGQMVSLRLFTGSIMKTTAIPEGAVVDDGGRPVVFVQIGGESFQRRPVQLGGRESGYVQVLDGVKPGERIVTRGAYLIRLAALSTQIPAHGHVH
jgi:membrane fusion protein, heavy metal efflux system